MKFLNFLAVFVFTFTIHNSIVAESAISFMDAPKFIGQTKTVEGIVVGTYCNEKMCFLNFHEDFKNNLSAVILADDFSKFSKAAGKELKAEMDKLYTGKKVQITGMLKEYKGKNDTKARPQISLSDSASIKVLSK
jgi:hypothetical protein